MCELTSYKSVIFWQSESFSVLSNINTTNTTVIDSQDNDRA